MLFFWIIVFAVSMAVLVKGADWLLIGAEKVGIALGIPPFIIGVTIVAAGTSFPELVSSIAAVIKGAEEVVAANVIGSNIANILLVVGLSAVFAGRLTVTKNLIDLDLPLLILSTTLFLGVVWDGLITVGESIILVSTYLIYAVYTAVHRDDEEVLSKESSPKDKPKLKINDFVFIAVGIAGLVVGSKYLIDSVISLSEILNVGKGIIAITAVAIGTSLPELLVSVKAAIHKKSEVALGNIFGSNVFNVLVVAGIPGLLGNLPLDEKTFLLGVPALAVTTLIFVISGISKRIYIWEGSFFLAIYALFLGKLFNLF
ncbi:MAG TPA: calcium/sodium antiporter [Candidatus Paceibacterota bacterium]